MKDSTDTVIITVKFENIYPIGIHSRDLMVVASTQTLTDKENHRPRMQHSDN